jgi:drug/metabolite transporter (DMT)-like permease
LETAQPSRYRAFTVAAGVLLALGGVVLIAGAVFFRGDEPTAISDPWSDVLAVAAATFLVVAILALLPDRAPAANQRRSPITFVAVLVGAASLVVFLVLVPGRAQLCCEDHTVPTIGRILPLILGVVAVVLGLWGLAVARGDARRVRGSLAAIAMGACSALVPLWLWTGYCNLFRSGC